MPPKSKSFWVTPPGILIAIAAVLGAVSVFIVVGYRGGFLGPERTQPPPTPGLTWTATSTAAQTPTGVHTQAVIRAPTGAARSGRGELLVETGVEFSLGSEEGQGEEIAVIAAAELDFTVEDRVGHLDTRVSGSFSLDELVKEYDTAGSVRRRVHIVGVVDIPYGSHIVAISGSLWDYMPALGRVRRRAVACSSHMSVDRPTQRYILRFDLPRLGPIESCSLKRLP